ncbi:hypothetical protein GW17_00011989 [Ensete ventricosum]|nr:hypothetical protein GW17_00011989 [Ensete ventricosum]
MAGIHRFLNVYLLKFINFIGFSYAKVESLFFLMPGWKMELQISTRTTHYWVVPPKSTIGGRLRERRKKKKRKRRKKYHLSQCHPRPHVIAARASDFLLCEETERLPARGERLR